MKRIFIIIFLGVSLITNGCTPANTNSEKENKISSSNIEKNSPSITHIDNKYTFTYLEELPGDKIEKYKLFLNDGDINHLTDFTPEQIVLVFMNLILKHNVYKIYDLTFDDGRLPSSDIFVNEYEEYLSRGLDTDYLTFRFYNSIKVDEKTRKENDVVVTLEITYGSTTRIMAYELKKDKNVWKMDLYHSIDMAKKENEK